ncbi:MAG TPA: DUF2203 domain-containing protein [Terriglobales bacterium]|nr:DUF2203 domain-containing protein [Terriglobales bacterium]
MSERTFTLDEAQVLLPVLESLLRRSIAGKQLIGKIEGEFQEVSQRIFLAGGTRVDIAHLAVRKAEKEKALQRVKDALAEIDSTGVYVKDLDVGLLDFPCRVSDQVILLCWKLGEKQITHWHGQEEGFQNRKPIDETITRAGKSKKQ